MAEAIEKEAVGQIDFTRPVDECVSYTLLIWDNSPDEVMQYLIPNDLITGDMWKYFRTGHGHLVNAIDLTDEQSDALNIVNCMLGTKYTDDDEKAKKLTDEEFRSMFGIRREDYTMYFGRLAELKVNKEMPLENIFILNVYYMGWLM